jgi:acylphosphatase
MPALMHLSAIVHGRVQGVFFRDFTRRQALGLGLTGYVRNLADGTVEAVAEGPQQALEKLLEQLRIGPSGAQVDRVDFRWGEQSGEFDRFEVLFR